MFDTRIGNSFPITIEWLVAFGHDEHNEQIDNYGVHLPVGEWELEAANLFNAWSSRGWFWYISSIIEVKLLSQVLCWSIDEECSGPGN